MENYDELKCRSDPGSNRPPAKSAQRVGTGRLATLSSALWICSLPATTLRLAKISVVPFMSLAGALILAFGVMFQTPIAVCALVRFGVISVEKLKQSRPYMLIVILIVPRLLNYIVAIYLIIIGLVGLFPQLTP